MTTIILDTNFLLLPYTEKVDVFGEIERLVVDECELCTLAGVLEELLGIRDNRESKGRDKIAAKIALQLIEKKKVKVIESRGRVDEQIIEYAKKNKETMVCTNDKELKRRLIGLGIPVIHIMSGRRLGLSSP
ncbi:MAG: nucleotide-binding protein [Candidatus Altiarchaeota archaeon]|nr:nucleotide-binding protein [Candidatus Altiarchaeota archaeon]